MNFLKTIFFRLVATVVVLLLAATFGDYAWIPIVLLLVIWLWPRNRP